MTTKECTWWVNHLFEIRKEEYFNKGWMEDAKEVDEAQQMAIDALSAEAVQGEWMEIEDYNGDIHYQCDRCGNEFILIDGTPKENNYNFCPNCGARMYKGGEDE